MKRREKITIEVYENVERCLRTLGMRCTVGPSDTSRVAESVVAGVMLSGMDFDGCVSTTDIFERVYAQCKMIR